MLCSARNDGQRISHHHHHHPVSLDSIFVVVNDGLVVEQQRKQAFVGRRRCRFTLVEMPEQLQLVNTLSMEDGGNSGDGYWYVHGKSGEDIGLNGLPRKALFFLSYT
jgi:hypothetical protein